MRSIVLAAMLAACAPGAPLPQAVPAPTPDEIAIRIGEAQNDASVEVGVGERFAVELVGVPTAGYVWQTAQLPDFLSPAGEATGNTTRAQSEAGHSGGRHWEVLMFTADAAGSGVLVLEQRRPWEIDQPAAQSFRVTIVAR